MITGISHVAFFVQNMQKALHFYCEVLGFTKAFEINDDDEKPWIIYLQVAEGQFIELFYGGIDSHKPAKAVGYNHLCLEVDDIQEIAHRIKAAGIALDAEIRQGKDQNYQCWVRDPDGNRIEFMQLHPDSPQKQV